MRQVLRHPKFLAAGLVLILLAGCADSLGHEAYCANLGYDSASAEYRQCLEERRAETRRQRNLLRGTSQGAGG